MHITHFIALQLSYINWGISVKLVNLLALRDNQIYQVVKAAVKVLTIQTTIEGIKIGIT